MNTNKRTHINAPVPAPVSQPTLEVGDQVMIRRNLNHPVWKIRVEGDPRSATDTYIPNPDITEDIGLGHIIQVGRHHSGHTARASNGFWYDTETGLQKNSDATTITKIVD